MTDKCDWLNQDGAIQKMRMFSDFKKLYLCNKITLEQLACFYWHSQQQLYSVDTLKM